MTQNRDEIVYDANGNARSFSGEGAVDVYAMAVLAAGLRMYATAGIIPNRAYTPKAMMQAAATYLGRRFKAREYLGAADALSERVQTEKARIAREAATPQGLADSLRACTGAVSVRVSDGEASAVSQADREEERRK